MADPGTEPAWWEPEPTPLEIELLQAVAIAWHDLGQIRRHSITVSATHEYLGEVMSWAVWHWQGVREEMRHDALEHRKRDETDPYVQKQMAELDRAIRTAPSTPALSNAEWDEIERQAALRSYLRGD